MKKKKKEVEHICKNCLLFDAKTSTCNVVILFEGERIKLPVLAEDPCFYEGEYFDPVTKSTETFADDIKEVKFWVENEKGEKINGNGIVKMEYPEGFFGDPIKLS